MIFGDAPPHTAKPSVGWVLARGYLQVGPGDPKLSILLPDLMRADCSGSCPSVGSRRAATAQRPRPDPHQRERTATGKYGPLVPPDSSKRGPVI